MIENHRFTLDDFKALNVCESGLQRVAAFGGAIENTPSPGARRCLRRCSCSGWAHLHAPI